MGGKSGATTGYTYFMGLHMSLSLGANKLRAITGGGNPAWSGSITSNTRININRPNLFGGDQKEGGLVGDLDVMFGAVDQMPNDYLVNTLEPGIYHPAYRGTFGVVWRQGEVAANNYYLKPWAFQLERTTAGWDGPVWYPAKAAIAMDAGIVGMNPAHIVYECVTNREWGMGWPASVLDLDSFTAAADTLYSEGFGLCMKWNQQELVENFLGIVMNHIGASFVGDRHTGKRKLILIRDDYVLASLPEFNVDNVLQLVSFERAALDNTINEITATWHDQVSNTDQAVTLQNLAAINAMGRIVSQSNSYPGLATAALANRIAQRDLRVLSTPLAKVQLKVNRSAYDLLPGEVRRFTWSDLGIVDMPLRIGDINFGTYADATITVTAVEDAFGLPDETYLGIAPGGWVEPDRSPQAVPYHRAFEATYRDLAHRLSAADLAALDATSGYVGTIGTRPSSVAYNYSVFSRLGSDAFADHGVGDFTPTAILAAAIGLTDTGMNITAGLDLDLVDIGIAALIDDEIVRVDALDPVTGALTLGRGCVDTMPAAHVNGSRIFFYGVHYGADKTEYLTGEAADVKLLTNTGIGQLDPASAATDTIILAQRQARPYPPAGLKVNGLAYPASIVEPLSLTWVARNRLTQGDQLIDTTAATITAEAGATYTLRIYLNNVLQSTTTGITALTASPSVTGYGPLRVEIDTVCNGLSSRQPLTASFDYRGSLAIATTSPVRRQHGISGTYQMLATGGLPPFTWSVDQLPAGMSMDANGLITDAGTAADGDTVCNFTLTDAASTQVNAAITVSVGDWTRRYWRLYVTQGGDPSYQNLRLIGLIAPSGGPNLCVGSGGIATQSSRLDTTFGAVHAFENPNLNGSGNPDGLYWHSASQIAPWWAAYDFGVAKLVGSIVIVPTNIAGRWPVNFSFQTSSDGVSWTDFKVYAGVTNWVLNQPMSFAVL